MGAGIIRTLAVLTTWSVGAALVPVAAGASARRASLTDEYCEPFSEFFTAVAAIEISIGLFEAFSQLDDESTDTDDVPDIDQLRAGFYVVFSPKLAAVSEELAEHGPRVVRSHFRRAQRIFERGVELLRDARLSEAEIEEIATTPIAEYSGDATEVTEDAPVDEAAFERLANSFLDEVEELDFGALPPRAERVLERSTTECGVVPSEAHSCDDVLPEAEAAEILGDDVTLAADGCAYSGPEPVDGLTAEIEVVVYESARAFDLLTAPIDDVEDVAGIGDDATRLEGFSADGRGITCGRTLVVADDDLTVVVALCLGGDDPEVTDDQLVEIAEGVLERI